ncbi:MAG: hypothetical protein ABIZ52_06160 [Candidatus Limnocylindrales bacterium]
MDDERDEVKELDLEEFLRMLPLLEAADLMSISATYAQAGGEARDGARAAASTAARKRGLIDELGQLQGSIIQWAGSDISRSAAYTLAGARPDQMLGDIRVQAVPALLDAATALLLKDALPEEQRTLLLEPMSAAVG